MKRLIIMAAALFGLAASASAQSTVDHDDIVLSLQVAGNMNSFRSPGNPGTSTAYSPGVSVSFGPEFIFGKRMQHVIEFGNHFEWLRSVGEAEGIGYNIEGFNDAFYLGYRFIFRSNFYLEALGLVGFMLGQKYTFGGTSFEDSPESKTPVDFSAGLGAGYYFGDHFWIFTRVKKSFSDGFIAIGAPPYTSLRMDIGIAFALPI